MGSHLTRKILVRKRLDKFSLNQINQFFNSVGLSG